MRGKGAHHEESRVHHSPGCWDDLPSSSVERLLSDDGIQDLELHIPDGCGQQRDGVKPTVTRITASKALHPEQQHGQIQQRSLTAVNINMATIIFVLNLSLTNESFKLQS